MNLVDDLLIKKLIIHTDWWLFIILTGVCGMDDAYGVAGKLTFSLEQWTWCLEFCLLLSGCCAPPPSPSSSSYWVIQASGGFLFFGDFVKISLVWESEKRSWQHCINPRECVWQRGVCVKTKMYGWGTNIKPGLNVDITVGSCAFKYKPSVTLPRFALIF